MNPPTFALQQSPLSPQVGIFGYFTDDHYIDSLKPIGNVISIQTITSTGTNIGMEKFIECKHHVLLLRLMKTTKCQNKKLRWCRQTKNENNYCSALMQEKSFADALIATDIVNESVLLHVYPAVFRMHYWTNEKQNLNYFDVFLPVENVTDIDFVQSQTGVSQIAFLCRDKQECFIQFASYNLEEQTIRLEERIQEGTSYEHLIAMPFPTAGFLLLGPNKITFRVCTKKISCNEEHIMSSNYKWIGVINNTNVLLFDEDNRLSLLDFVLNEVDGVNDVTGLTVKFIKGDNQICSLWSLENGLILIRFNGEEFQIACLKKTRNGEYQIQNHQETLRNMPCVVKTVEKIKIGEILKDRFRIETKVGKGNYGDVFKIFDENKLSGELILKMMSKEDQKEFDHELDVLSRSGNIVGIPKIVANFAHKSNLCIVMEYAGESLGTVLARNKSNTFSQGNICRIGFSLMNTVHQLHQIGYSHRDLHDHNILLYMLPTNRVVVKLIDFGCVFKLNNGKTRVRDSCTDFHSCVDLLFKMANQNPCYYELESRDSFLKKSIFDQVTAECHWLVGLYQIIDEQEKKIEVDMLPLFDYFKNALPSVDPLSDIVYEIVNGKLCLE